MFPKKIFLQYCTVHVAIVQSNVTGCFPKIHVPNYNCIVGQCTTECTVSQPISVECVGGGSIGHQSINCMDAHPSRRFSSIPDYQSQLPTSEFTEVPGPPEKPAYIYYPSGS